MTPESPRQLSNAELDALLHDLQKRAFELYEDAALRAETHPARASEIYARAEAGTAPLIAQARRLNDERTQRFRRRAGRWRRTAVAVLLVGGVAVTWLVLQR